MIYIERPPAEPLNQCIRSLWYAHAPDPLPGRERILPNGCIQMVINPDRDFILECAEGDIQPARRLSCSLIVGARSAYEIVDRSDMAEVIGIVFRPGGFAPFAGDAADVFSNRDVTLEDVWGAKATTLRDQLRATSTPRAKLATLGAFALRNSMVDFALSRFAGAPALSTVQEVAAQTGWSMRHFSQVFREQVGLTPKV